MKNFFTASLVFCLISFSTIAEEFPGVIYTENDTLEVVMKIPVNYIDDQPDFLKLQKGIKYFNENNRKEKILPVNARLIKIDYFGTEYYMESVPLKELPGSILAGEKRIFVQRLVGGYQNLYSYYAMERDLIAGTGMIIAQSYLLQTGEGVFYFVGDGPASFRKRMREYYFDCPEVMKKVEDKIFRFQDIVKMVKYYNEYCGE
ncbi:MAG: hypothetical protein WBA74_01385 [Cyclobacteriaceae bacterium]